MNKALIKEYIDKQPIKIVTIAVRSNKVTT